MFLLQEAQMKHKCPSRIEWFFYGLITMLFIAMILSPTSESSKCLEEKAQDICSSYNMTYAEKALTLSNGYKVYCYNLSSMREEGKKLESFFLLPEEEENCKK
jgi:hypothetical protein